MTCVADDDIVKQVIGGNVNAFEYLLKKYQGHVMKIIRKHIPGSHADEAAQDVFVRAYQALPNYKKKDSFKPWLSVIAVRTCYDFWRKRYRSRERPMSELSDRHQDWLQQVLSDQSSLSYHDIVRKKEARELLDTALNQLSAEERIILELVHLEGLSGKEVSQLLGWSIANVKIRSYRARKKLHKILTPWIEETEGGRH
ncbi:MAG: RNA polymerase sigma factor [Desulfobacterales bacterium]|nr:RNA polymerase sigma factor [Desulfobacterales bacterium]MDD4392821.1 RNA polymerase sigma factor [Desulfobacterales bacterium]